MMIENSSMHAPYVRMGRGSYRVMCDVLIAMIPPIVWAVYVFGGRAVTMIVVGVTFASAADYSFRRFIFRKGNDFDVSAAVTGILIGFALPVSAPFSFLLPPLRRRLRCRAGASGSAFCARRA